MTKSPAIDSFEQSLLSLDRVGAKQALLSGNRNQSPLEAVEDLVVPALENIGTAWENGKVSLSQVYMSGRICEELVDEILPPGNSERTQQPAMAIVVLDDYHLLGKRIVYSALRASGFELSNYEHMDIDTLVQHVQKDQIKILLISVLMLPSALHIKEVRKILDREKYPLKIIVGGAPFRFDDQLWQEVGADAMGASASEAVAVVNKFIKEVE